MKKSKQLVRFAHSFTIYCPVISAKMILTSDDVDGLGPFSRFVLWTVGNRGGVERVQEVTALDPRVIAEEFAYLSKIGLFTPVENKDLYHLTELGEHYFRLITCVDVFNEREVVVQINAVTGLLMPNDRELLTYHEVPSGATRLEEQIILELYQNEDPANARDFLFEHHSFYELNEEELANLHVTLYYQSQVMFRPIELGAAPVLPEEQVLYTIRPNLSPRLETANDEQMGERWLTVETTFLPFQLRITAQPLEPYRTTLDTLSKLADFDLQLLGEKALRLLELWQLEQDLAKRLPQLYFDVISGEFVRELPAPPPNIRRVERDRIRIPAEFHAEDITTLHAFDLITILLDEILDLHWHIVWEIGDPIPVVQKVAAHLLLHEEGEESA